jgi:Zn-dependent metalloprotease
MSIRFHVQEDTDAEAQAITSPPRATRGAGITAPRTAFDNDEAAARYYLGRVLGRDQRPVVRGLTAAERPELVPDMRLDSVQDQPLTKTKLVRFAQTQSDIPIFGSRAVVELDQKRGLLACNGQVARVDQISPIPSISQKEALARIANLAQVDPAQLETLAMKPATLTFFHDEADGSWHLAFHFEKVPVAPADFLQQANQRTSQGHGLGRSPRQLSPILDYLVDAHDGKVLFYYSKTPMVARCTGVDELGAAQTFYGEQLTDAFELYDALRRLKTYDLQLADLTSPFPQSPIRQPTARFTNTAAVSAHVNGMRVYDFYKSVLMRDGVDDKGMELISAVNCTYAAHEPAPQWHNAVWWDDRIWYGQLRDDEKFRSYARYLDVIAHELTHGVTQYTADLVYKDQSGALNESFSDIFGVIINNWYTVGADSSVAGWNWEIGPGLGDNGLPLRDLRDPRRTRDPDHMNQYLKTPLDNGGVHTNSNIHNKAASNVLTATDANGQYAFTVRDVAVLYYLCLSRLSSLATFAEVLQALVDVANTYYAGDPGGPGAKVQSIRDAYQKVGIS